MNTNIGEKIKILRNEENLTQPQLAKLVGVANSVISNWENNNNFPRGDYVAKLSKILNTSTDYLLGLEDEFGNDYTKDLPPIHLINKETQKVKNRITIELSDEQLKKLLTQIDNSDSNELTFEYKHNNTHLIHKEKK